MENLTQPEKGCVFYFLDQHPPNGTFLKKSCFRTVLKNFQKNLKNMVLKRGNSTFTQNISIKSTKVLRSGAKWWKSKPSAPVSEECTAGEIRGTIVLIGSYNHTIDAKGRLFIPAKWREDLGPVFIVTKGFGKCLFGMSLAQWQALSEKLAALPIADGDAQDFVRYLSSWATDCELDKQGRILIPPKLREEAMLEKDTTLIGVTGRIEIWNTANWEEKDSQMAGHYDAMMRSMAARGF